MVDSFWRTLCHQSGSMGWTKRSGINVNQNLFLFWRKHLPHKTEAARIWNSLFILSGLCGRCPPLKKDKNILHIRFIFNAKAALAKDRQETASKMLALALGLANYASGAPGWALHCIILIENVASWHLTCPSPLWRTLVSRPPRTIA